MQVILLMKCCSLAYLNNVLVNERADEVEAHDGARLHSSEQRENSIHPRGVIPAKWHKKIIWKQHKVNAASKHVRPTESAQYGLVEIFTNPINYRGQTTKNKTHKQVSCCQKVIFKKCSATLFSVLDSLVALHWWKQNMIGNQSKPNLPEQATSATVAGAVSYASKEQSTYLTYCRIHLAMRLGCTHRSQATKSQG